MIALPRLFVRFYQLRTTLECFLTTKCIPWSSSITMYHLTSNHQLCHFIFPQLLTLCWTSPPSLTFPYFSNWAISRLTIIKTPHQHFLFHLMDHASQHHHSSRQLPVTAYLFILCPCSNVRITHPSSFGVFPNLKLVESKCRIVKPFLLRIFELSDAVWRYATYQLLQRLLLIYTSQNVYMPCLLLLSNDPIRHTYVYYFNHRILQSITLTLGNPVWYIQQRFRAELPFQAPLSSYDRWYVFLLGLADLQYLLPSAQFSMTILTFYRDDA